MWRGRKVAQIMDLMENRKKNLFYRLTNMRKNSTYIIVYSDKAILKSYAFFLINIFL